MQIQFYFSLFARYFVEFPLQHIAGINVPYRHIQRQLRSAGRMLAFIKSNDCIAAPIFRCFYGFNYHIGLINGQ